jgi:hypothetical protein
MKCWLDLLPFAKALSRLSTWYTRYEVHKRYSVFYMLGIVASAFSGILAYGIMQLGGRDNLAGWRWIFIVEGLITVFLALCGYLFLVDFPDTLNPKTTWRFLNEHELKFVVDRVDADRADVHIEPFSLRKYLGCASDMKVWAFAMLYFDTTTLTYSMAYFLPIILRDGMGFVSLCTFGMFAMPADDLLDGGPGSVPDSTTVRPRRDLDVCYWYVGFFTPVRTSNVLTSTGWIGDKYKIRGPIVIFHMVVVIVGLAVMGWAKDTAARYFGVFLVAAGANSNVPVLLAYQANNIRGQWKRAFCSATLVGFGGIGGIAGTLIFRYVSCIAGVYCFSSISEI